MNITMIITCSVMQTIIAIIVLCVCVCVWAMCDLCLYPCLGPNCCFFSAIYQLLAIKLTWPDSTPHTGR